MKLVNRGFISLKPKQAFWDWANQFDAELSFSENDECEGTTYLVEEDFFDFEPLLEKHFKKMFKNECAMVNDDERSWPENINLDLFHSWFHVDYGSSVLDLEKDDLRAEKID